jgi:hypothetical protein
VVAFIDARLAAQQAADPPDRPGDAAVWRASLTALGADAVERYQSPFSVLDGDRRDRLILHVRDLGAQSWHGMRADLVWRLWTGYACTAFYSHPFAWSAAGFRL